MQTNIAVYWLVRLIIFGKLQVRFSALQVFILNKDSHSFPRSQDKCLADILEYDTTA